MEGKLHILKRRLVKLTKFFFYFERIIWLAYHEFVLVLGSYFTEYLKLYLETYEKHVLDDCRVKENHTLLKNTLQRSDCWFKAILKSSN